MRCTVSDRIALSSLPPMLAGGRAMAMALRPLVVCGPSGVGKGTLLKRLLKDYSNDFSVSVSHTTRAPRAGEVDGVQYHFTTRERMEEDVKQGKFIETAEFAGNMYGTSCDAVRAVLDVGRVCILEIDIQGALSVAKTDLNARFVFIEPPSWEELEQRLRGRGTESDETLQRRLATAKQELEFAKSSPLFEKVITNDDLDRAYEELVEFARAGFADKS